MSKRKYTTLPTRSELDEIAKEENLINEETEVKKEQDRVDYVRESPVKDEDIDDIDEMSFEDPERNSPENDEGEMGEDDDFEDDFFDDEFDDAKERKKKLVAECFASFAVIITSLLIFRKIVRRRR